MNRYAMILARRVASRPLMTTTTGGFAAAAARRTFSTKPLNEADFVPPEDYYDGHLMTDHLEYIDDMLAKTIKLEQGLDELYESHARARQNVQWTSSSEDIDRLFFDKSAQKKNAIHQHVQDLKELMADLRRQNVFAVDAPDGDSDGHAREELQEVGHILNEAAAYQTTVVPKLEREHAQAQKTFAVDSPDGDSDASVLSELDEVNHLIDNVAKTENKQEIRYQHSMEREVHRFHARDPEHDW